jgi:hypothetical protein
MGIGVAIILVAIGISTAMQQPQKSDSLQIISVGPIWNTNSWTCTSDSDFIVHGALRGLAGSLVEINISNVGAQSLFALEEGRLEPFTVGADAGNYITVTRSGILTGFITMQTSSDAIASCTPI